MVAFGATSETIMVVEVFVADGGDYVDGLRRRWRGLFVCMAIRLSGCPSSILRVCLSFCRSSFVCLTTCLFVFLYFRLSVFSALCFFEDPSFSLSCLLFYLSFCRSIGLPFSLLSSLPASSFSSFVKVLSHSIPCNQPSNSFVFHSL